MVYCTAILVPITITIKENIATIKIIFTISFQDKLNYIFKIVLYSISKRDHGNREKEEEYFNAEQNAITAKDAEFYYRTMIRGDIKSWNIRDSHMMETLEGLIAFHDNNNNKTNSKAIVWAHNTHIGDARATDMFKDNMISLGQLVRERKNKNNTVLIGLGTYKGSVIAAKKRGEKMEQMEVPPAINGSWDNILHNIKKESTTITPSYHNNNNNNKLIIFSDDNINNIINNGDWRGQRTIGVVYNPQYEKYGNYVPTDINSRYDAFLFIDETHALHPLHMETIKDKDPPETFPTGL